MRPDSTRGPLHLRRATACALCLLLAGCAAVAQRASDRLATNLGQAVLDHDDPDSVRDGLPAYLLLLDALVHGDPDNPATLRAAAQMYASYAGSFVDDAARAGRLAARAREYSRRATCLDLKALCVQLDQPFDAFRAAVRATPDADTEALYGLAGAWATWIQTHSEDYGAIADIPKVEVLLQRVVEQRPGHDRGMPWVYLGVLGSLRPEGVGGRPEQGKQAFERALELSKGRNLMAKTLYARHYARLVFDQELHDRLLREVLAAEPREPGFTLANVLAQRQAEALLRTSPDYF